jgi:hypothetical protein
MELPTACRLARTRSSRQPASTNGIRDRHALPSRTTHRHRRAARFRRIGDGQPSRRSSGGGTQSSRVSPDRSGSARLAPQTACTSRQSVAALRRDLRPAKLPRAFDHRGLCASWRSTIRPTGPRRSQSGSRVHRSLLHGGPVRPDSAATKSRNQATGRVSLADGQPGKRCAFDNQVSRVESVGSDRPPGEIPARHRETGDDSGCQRRPKKWIRPGDLPRIADQRLTRNCPPKRLGVKRSRVQIPAARLMKELVEAMPIRVGSEAALPDSRTLALTLEDFVNYRFMLDTARGFPAVFDQ